MATKRKTGTKKRVQTNKTRKKSSRVKKHKQEPDILDSVYEAMQDLDNINLIDPVTMRQFDSLCKKPISNLTPIQIKDIRLQEGLSQPVFAWYMNVRPTTVKKWENGENSPSGPALLLLDVIKRHGLSHIYQ